MSEAPGANGQQVRIRATISGRVQGVSFRQTLALRAARLELAGFVRNLPDGRVEACLEGPLNLVEALLEWCWEGPPAARVTGVAQMREPVLGEIGFRVEP